MCMMFLQAVEECVDILANRLYNGGRIKDKCESAGVYERLILLDRQFKGAAVLLHKMGYLPVAFRNLWSHERLLNVVEQIIGPDIAGEEGFIHKLWCMIRNLCPRMNYSGSSGNDILR